MAHTQQGFSLPEMLVTLALLLLVVDLIGTAAHNRLEFVQNRAQQRAAQDQEASVRPADLRLPVWRSKQLHQQHQELTP